MSRRCHADAVDATGPSSHEFYSVVIAYSSMNERPNSPKPRDIGAGVVDVVDVVDVAPMSRLLIRGDVADVVDVAPMSSGVLLVESCDKCNETVYCLMRAHRVSFRLLNTRHA